MVSTAIILCPAEVSTDRRLLGLTVGERLLLSLHYAGVKRISFVGDGPRPQCARAQLEEVPLSAIADREPAWVVPCNTTVNKNIFQNESDYSSLPVRLLRKSELPSDVATYVSSLPTGGEVDGNIGVLMRDKAAWRLAGKALRKSLRKPIDGIASRYINRHISIATTRLLSKTNIAPNVFTLFFTVIGIAAGICAAIGQPWWMLVVAGGLFQAQSILDGCDGELARLKYQYSQIGQWFDSIGDDLTNYIFCLGLAIGLGHTTGEPLYYWIGGFVLLGQIIATVLLYGRMIKMGTGDLLAIPDLVSGGEPEGTWGKIVSGGRALMKRDVFVLVIAALTAAQLPQVGFGLFAVGSTIMVFGVVLNEMRIVKQEKLTSEDTTTSETTPKERIAA